MGGRTKLSDSIEQTIVRPVLRRDELYQCVSGITKDKDREGPCIRPDRSAYMQPLPRTTINAALPLWQLAGFPAQEADK
jgi:hypothetical protein